MKPEKTPGFVTTNPRIPALIGTLNLIFGIMLLLYALGWIAWTLALPHRSTYFTTEHQMQRSKELAKKEGELAELKKQEATASPAEVKSRLRSEIVALENDLELNFRDLRKVSQKEDLRIVVPEWIDAILGLVLSILMVVSGIWLLELRSWGRTLALWVAATKVAWLTLGFFYALTVTIPIATEQVMVEFQKEAANTGPVMGGVSPKMIAGTTAAAAGTTAVAAALISAIFPSLTIWLLNKQTVKAAFLTVPRREKPQGSSLTVAEST